MMIVLYKDGSRPFIITDADIEVLLGHIRLQLKHNPEVISSIRIIPGIDDEQHREGASMESLCFAFERDDIENLILGGMDIPSIQKMFPHYNKREIEKMVEDVAKYCWLDEKDWRHYRLYGKPLSLNELTYNENGECIADLLTKSFSEFYLTKLISNGKGPESEELNNESE